MAARRRTVKIADVEALFRSAIDFLNLPKGATGYLNLNAKVGDKGAVSDPKHQLEEALMKVGPQLGYQMVDRREDSDE